MGTVGKPHGTGKWVAQNGITYDGEWKEGMRHGYGVKTYISGNKYSGYWHNGLKHGDGVMNIAVPIHNKVERVPPPTLTSTAE